MVLWTIACCGYVLRVAWKNSDSTGFWVLGFWIGLQGWFYGIVPLGILFAVFGRSVVPRQRDRQRLADIAVRRRSRP